MKIASVHLRSWVVIKQFEPSPDIPSFKHAVRINTMILVRPIGWDLKGLSVDVELVVTSRKKPVGNSADFLSQWNVLIYVVKKFPFPPK